MRQQATSCVHDAHGFFVGQDAAPVWYTTMVEILDNALVALDGKLPNGGKWVVTAECVAVVLSASYPECIHGLYVHHRTFYCMCIIEHSTVCAS